MRQPWMMESPTPPQPKTAAVEPGVTGAVLIAAPTPVMTPQPTNAALSRGMLLSIFTAAVWGTTACSAMQPRNCMTPSCVSPMRAREVPSSIKPLGAPAEQRAGRWWMHS